MGIEIKYQNQLQAFEDHKGIIIKEGIMSMRVIEVNFIRKNSQEVCFMEFTFYVSCSIAQNDIIYMERLNKYNVEWIETINYSISNSIEIILLYVIRLNAILFVSFHILLCNIIVLVIWWYTVNPSFRERE